MNNNKRRKEKRRANPSISLSFLSRFLFFSSSQPRYHHHHRFAYSTHIAFSGVILNP